MYTRIYRVQHFHRTKLINIHCQTFLPCKVPFSIGQEEYHRAGGNAIIMGYRN